MSVYANFEFKKTVNRCRPRSNETNGNKTLNTAQVTQLWIEKASTFDISNIQMKRTSRKV